MEWTYGQKAKTASTIGPFVFTLPSSQALAGITTGLLVAMSPLHFARAQQQGFQPSNDLPPKAPTWELVPINDDARTTLSWKHVPEGEEINAEQLAAEDKSTNASASKDTREPPPTPWVTGGLYQVKRGDAWLPAITQRVPSGYGNRFAGFQAGLFLESCNVTGNYVCGTKSFTDEFNSNAKGAVDFVVGLGDPVKLIGIDLGFNFTSLATTRPDQNSEGTKFGSGQGLNLSVSRNLGRDTSLKVGAINLIELDEVQLDTGRSAYAVLSARIDLGGPKDKNTNDLYLTAGIANGLFRPLNQIVADQEQECSSERNKTGSNKTYKYGLQCNVNGLDYGSPAPVASLAYLINPQISLIAEWWGRNLTLAASFKPFEKINWVITPGITNLVRNADWDPSVPGYTERYRLQLTTSIGF